MANSGNCGKDILSTEPFWHPTNDAEEINYWVLCFWLALPISGIQFIYVCRLFVVEPSHWVIAMTESYILSIAWIFTIYLTCIWTSNLAWSQAVMVTGQSPSSLVWLTFHGFLWSSNSPEMNGPDNSIFYLFLQLRHLIVLYTFSYFKHLVWCSSR